MARITLLIQERETELFEIIKSGLVMLLFAAGSLACACVVTVCAASISSSFGGSLREKLFCKIMSFSMEEVSHFSTASLITRTTNADTVDKAPLFANMLAFVQYATQIVTAIVMKNLKT